MSESHTPGPWTHTKHRCGIYINGGKWEGGALRIARLTVAKDRMFVGEAEANARLMIAAPDLLAACKEALDRLLRIHGPTTVAERDDIMRVRDLCRAAIAKAGGATNV